MSRSHWDYTDSEFEERFATGRFPLSLFSHEAHLRLAFIHIRNYGRDVAKENLCEQIKRAADRVGYHDKFHKTITCASVDILCMHGAENKETTFYAFKERYPELLNNFKGKLAAHYSERLLYSEKARSEYVMPDKADFVN